MRYLSILLLLTVSCKQDSKDLLPQQIIDRTIENSGGSNYEHARIHFTFRDIDYSSFRKGGIFELTRKFTDSLGEIEDVLTNDGFARYRNSEKVILPDSLANQYSNSLNAVHYFVQLPFGLNDPAVHKELLEETEIKGNYYYTIKVTFSQEGGGADHEDVYIYWIEKDDFTVDYFAYKFFTDNGGIRFREAYNPRTIGGIRFVDYRNYKIEPWQAVELKNLGQMFDRGKLEFLSDIKTEVVSVETTLRD